MNYRIISTNCKAFWSNADGWVGLKGSDIFTDKERETLNLPIDGCWVPAEPVKVKTVTDLAQFLDFLPQKMKLAPTFAHDFNHLDASLTVGIVGLDEFGYPIADDDDATEVYGLHCKVRM